MFLILTALKFRVMGLVMGLLILQFQVELPTIHLLGLRIINPFQQMKIFLIYHRVNIKLLLLTLMIAKSHLKHSKLKNQMNY